MKISLFEKYNNPIPIKELDFLKVLNIIKSDKLKNQIKEVRLLINDKEKRDIEKKKLQQVTWCGTFTYRSNDRIKQSSGLACLDFDEVDDLQILIANVNQDKYTLTSFISPSGNGLKVLVKIPFVDSDVDYKSFYFKLQEHYNQYGVTDDATKDISRATYLSYDPNLYLNLESELFTDRQEIKEVVEFKPVTFKIEDQEEVAQRLVVWFKKHWTTGTNRNNNLFKLCAAFNDYGIDKQIAYDYCSQYQSKDFRDKEIKLLVDSAYKHESNFGSKSFEDTKTVEVVKKMVESGSSISDVKNRFGELDNLEETFNKIKSNIDTSIFWEIGERGKISISYVLFDNYLKSKGISKYYPYLNVSDFDFIKNDNNFINWIDPTRIKDIVKNDLISNGNYDIWDFMAKNNSIFKKDNLSMLDTVEVSPKKDDKDNSFIFYNNYAVRTSRSDIELIKYKDIDEVIWKNQVIDRDIELNNESEGEFKTFIWLLSKKNVERYYTLKSVIGYLLHSYQHAKPKAIIFNDEMLSDDIPNGGSGKGLIHKGIGHIKNIVVEDGKKFDSKSQFAYQNVNKDTQIFLMDDVPKNFNFENLFSIITEGMTVEKKGKDSYRIPFSESPKISITTNYTVKGDGASHKRRVFEVEIANHFNDNHTPEDEFGHQFFNEWDQKEWAKFDNFMIRCIQFYLKNGLVESNKVNLELRKLRNNLGFEFIEFMEMNPFKERIGKKDVRDYFNRQYPNLAKFNTAQKFNNKVKEYCKFYELTLTESKYNGSDCWLIEGTEESNDLDALPF
jgi:hypothetical protein